MGWSRARAGWRAGAQQVSPARFFSLSSPQTLFRMIPSITFTV